MVQINTFIYKSCLDSILFRYSIQFLSKRNLIRSIKWYYRSNLISIFERFFLPVCSFALIYKCRSEIVWIRCIQFLPAAAGWLTWNLVRWKKSPWPHCRIRWMTIFIIVEIYRSQWKGSPEAVQIDRQTIYFSSEKIHSHITTSF